MSLSSDLPSDFQPSSTENDLSILASIYSKEKRKLLDEMETFRSNLQATFPNFQKDFGETLDEFMLSQQIKSLHNLKQRIYGVPKPLPPNEKSHLWIGINPPPKSITLKALWEKHLGALQKYKCLATHASCCEAHTSNGYRPHIHLLALTNEKPNRLITALANHFQISKNSIECKAFHKGNAFGEHYDYIVGSKKTSKMKDVDLDVLERAKLEIPDYFQNIFS